MKVGATYLIITWSEVAAGKPNDSMKKLFLINRLSHVFDRETIFMLEYTQYANGLVLFPERGVKYFGRNVTDNQDTPIALKIMFPFLSVRKRWFLILFGR